MNPLISDKAQALEHIRSDSTWPEWFTVGKSTPKSHIRNVSIGRHPMGIRLLGKEGHTCGNCANRVAEQHCSRIFHKCSLLKITNGRGTDLRLKWPACTEWEKR